MKRIRLLDIALATAVLLSAAFFSARLIWDGGYTLRPDETPTAMMTTEEFLQTSTLDINEATLLDFCAFDGIGYGIAHRIIDYREAHGGFSSVEELREVALIGEKRYEAMLPFVCCLSR